MNALEASLSQGPQRQVCNEVPYPTRARRKLGTAGTEHDERSSAASVALHESNDDQRPAANDRRQEDKGAQENRILRNLRSEGEPQREKR